MTINTGDLGVVKILDPVDCKAGLNKRQNLKKLKTRIEIIKRGRRTESKDNKKKIQELHPPI